MRRSIPMSVILVFVTFGIYGLYWMVVLTDEVNYLSGRRFDTSGGKALFFTIITFGLFGIYWAYKMGEKISFIKEMYYGRSSNDSIIYTILFILNLEIIIFPLIQNEMNNIIDGRNNPYSMSNGF